MSTPQEQPSSESNDISKPAVLGRGYRHFGVLALAGTVFGTIIAGVLSTSSTDATIVMVYAAPILATVGIVGGVRYGFFFNTVNRCTGGRLLFGTIAGLIAAAAGALFVSLLMVIIGTVRVLPPAGSLDGFYTSRDEKEFRGLVRGSGPSPKPVGRIRKLRCVLLFGEA